MDNPRIYIFDKTDRILKASKSHFAELQILNTFFIHIMNVRCRNSNVCIDLDYIAERNAFLQTGRPFKISSEI